MKKYIANNTEITMFKNAGRVYSDLATAEAMTAQANQNARKSLNLHDVKYITVQLYNRYTKLYSGYISAEATDNHIN